ncbi:MAG: zinc ribbon domain-containing protein [Bacillota bacterium]|nr:MAG: FmdB family transcriptional regulator [Bacillota bacterium]
MPVYQYRCEKCGDFEVEQAITESPFEKCPTCGNPVRRLISRNVGIVFKGSGFHITDYVRKDSGENSSGDSSEKKND